MYLTFRIDKDKIQIMAEISDVRAATDEVGRSKVRHLSLHTKVSSYANLIMTVFRPLQRNPIKTSLPLLMALTKRLKKQISNLEIWKQAWED